MTEYKIKTIIFDIDGTLIDTFSASTYALQRVLYEVTGIKYTPDMLIFHFGIPLFDALEKLGIAKDKYREITALVDQYYYQGNRPVKFFNNIEKVVKAISQNDIFLGIVTSKDRLEYENDFSMQEIAPLFDLVICADDTIKHKPEPDPIEKFIEMSKVDKKSTIYIGDTIYDCECAHKAGIKFALAGWGATNKNIDADCFLNDPTDILKLIK